MKKPIEHLKEAYTYREDGIFSNIFLTKHGEYSNFKQAKKDLVRDMKIRMQDFKAAYKEIRAKKQSDIEGEGQFFDIDYDQTYSTITRSKYGEHKNFSSAKKELLAYLDTRFRDYQYAWKDAVAKKEEDVEEL